MGWFSDRWLTLKEAAGQRRYFIGGACATVLTLIDALSGYGFMSWLTGAPSWTIVIIVALASTLLWLLNYANDRRKELEPKIEARFKPHLPFVEHFVCRTPTKSKTETFIAGSSAVTMSSGGGFTMAKASFVRVGLINRSQATVVGCIAHVTKVEKKQGRKWAATKFSDAQQIRRAKCETGEYEPFDVPPSDEPMFFFDVFSVDEEHEAILMKWKGAWIAHEGIFDDIGDYRITILISPKEGAQATAQIEIGWAGKWDDFKLGSTGSKKARITWPEANTSP